MSELSRLVLAYMATRPPVVVSLCAACSPASGVEPVRDFDCQVMPNGSVSPVPAIGLCDACGRTAHDPDALPGAIDRSHKRSTDRPGRMASKVTGKPDGRLNAYVKIEQERLAAAKKSRASAKRAEARKAKAAQKRADASEPIKAGPIKFRPKGAKPGA